MTFLGSHLIVKRIWVNVGFLKIYQHMHLFCLIESTVEIRRQYHRIIFKHNISKKHTRYFNITMCLSNASNRPAFQSGPRVSCWILYPFQQCSKQCEQKCHVLEGHIYHNHITFYTQRQFPSVVKEQQTQLRVCLEKWKIASLSSQSSVHADGQFGLQDV